MENEFVTNITNKRAPVCPNYYITKWSLIAKLHRYFLIYDGVKFFRYTIQIFSVGISKNDKF